MTTSLENNKFIDKTKVGLDLNEDDPRLGVRGFEFDNSTSEKDCVLVIGLNPAGNDEDANNEKNNRTYLYSLKNSIKSNYVYNKYYKPIYDLMNDIFDNKAKWHWCNKSWDILSKEIEHSEDKDFLDMIHEEYLNHQNSKVTIYIGDMFYYHQTSSKILPLIKSESYLEYCKEMLELHIESLIEAGKNIKFVYINNSQVSQWLCASDIKTFTDFGDRDIPVFFGGMVSGGRMDLFSKKRLVHEIKNYLNKLESKIEK
ncbi:hypothetical protein [Gemella morbillorum]|jgi:hypothetical protein|uniref:hypothetical protein n=1 Tax=Gemella morbillorum TaxID=29391 RepID=UPI0023F542B1|nr:hypothetical protein [Gemella morbillorum]